MDSAVSEAENSLKSFVTWFECLGQRCYDSAFLPITTEFGPLPDILLRHSPELLLRPEPLPLVTLSRSAPFEHHGV
jgi:hypothetical protein